MQMMSGYLPARFTEHLVLEFGKESIAISVQDLWTFVLFSTIASLELIEEDGPALGLSI